MAKNSAQTQQDVLKKLTTKSSGDEAASAIMAGLMLIIVIAAAFATTGLLSFALWCVVAVQGFGMIMRMVGWKTVVLTNEEQLYLINNYKG